MNQQIIENCKKNGNTIYANAMKVLSLLCESVTLMSEIDCEYDTLFDGSVVVYFDYDSKMTRNVNEAIDYLNSLIKSFYQQ
jgi:hypothetical protein